MAAKKTASAKAVVNPFDKGVTYEDFLKALPKGKKVADYLKEVCTADQIAWIETEIEHYKNK